jgi:hypothetical protein
MFVYDKDGNEITCDNDQVENMLEAGYTKTMPVIASKITDKADNVEKADDSKSVKKKLKKDIIL